MNGNGSFTRRFVQHQGGGGAIGSDHDQWKEDYIKKIQPTPP